MSPTADENQFIEIGPERINQPGDPARVRAIEGQSVTPNCGSDESLPEYCGLLCSPCRVGEDVEPGLQHVGDRCTSANDRGAEDRFGIPRHAHGHVRALAWLDGCEA